MTGRDYQRRFWSAAHVSIQYETGAEAYRWLNRIVAVASAVRLADQVIYDAYALT